jgi:hypothetical protein
MKLFAASLTTIALALAISHRQATAADSDQWQDWQVTISMQSFKPYLDYPDSPLSKLNKASVTFAQPAKGQSRSYEDLYYTNSQVIGCRRNGDLDVTHGAAGIIRVTSTSGDQSYGAANAVGRVFLDLFMQKCPTKAIVVPRANFNSIISAMCSQGFRIAPPLSARLSQGTPSVFMLTVVSDPPGETQEIMM